VIAAAAVVVVGGVLLLLCLILPDRYISQRFLLLFVLALLVPLLVLAT